MSQLTPEMLEMLEDTTERFIREGRAFTAYNVTLACRQDNGIELRHKWVQEAASSTPDGQNPIHHFPMLREAHEYGDYQQTRIEHPNKAGVWAWLYHPSCFDPATFQWEDAQKADPPEVRDDNAQAAYDSQVAADTAVAAADTSSQPSDDGSFGTDYRNRLFVPTPFLRDAGLSKYDTCYVVIDSANKQIMLATETDALNTGGCTVATQTVERNGDIRLSSKTLNMAGFDENGKFQIENTEEGDGPTPISVVKITAFG